MLDLLSVCLKFAVKTYVRGLLSVKHMWEDYYR